MEFEMQPYIVYVKTDEQNRITTINSSAFIPDPSGWVEIDSGFGDKYHHAQGNYFDKPITDDRGIWRYKLVDGKHVERTQEEMDADWIEPENKPSLESRVEMVETDTGELKEALDMLLAGVTE